MTKDEYTEKKNELVKEHESNLSIYIWGKTKDEIKDTSEKIKSIAEKLELFQYLKEYYKRIDKNLNKI